MRYFACAALLALLTVFGCDNNSGTLGSSGSSGSTPLAITTTTIPGFVIPGVPGPLPAYNATISATGGTGNYAWSVVSGSLPAGLTLSPTGTPDATISGTMSTPSTTTFTVQVTDASSNTATMTYTLTVIAAPTPPPPPTPTYFGQAVTGRVLFICDVSSATAGQPLANVQTELSATLGSMTSVDEFDIAVFNSSTSGYVKWMWGAALPATSGNIASAVAWVNGPNFAPAGSPDNACYAALQAAYGTTGVDQAFLFTWTTPGDANNILADFPTWAANDPNRQLIVIAKNSANGAFAQQLAALAGGTYVP